VKALYVHLAGRTDETSRASSEVAVDRSKARSHLTRELEGRDAGARERREDDTGDSSESIDKRRKDRHRLNEGRFRPHQARRLATRAYGCQAREFPMEIALLEPSRRIVVSLVIGPHPPNHRFARLRELAPAGRR
jgi:hypothetical protein